MLIENAVRERTTRIERVSYGTVVMFTESPDLGFFILAKPVAMGRDRLPLINLASGEILTVPLDAMVTPFEATVKVTRYADLA